MRPILLQLDLGGLQNEIVLAGTGRLQLEFLDAPAVVAQDAAEGRLASHVPGQANGRGIKADWHFDRFVLFLIQHRLKDDMLT